MKVFVGSDYRGFELKQHILRYLAGKPELVVIDCGAYQTETRDDYNDAAVTVARQVREEPPITARGILICDSSHGMVIQANRFKGVRAASCETAESAVLAREHDDANVLCLSGHFVDGEAMKPIVDAFLETPFDGEERRVRRINRLDERQDYA